MLQVWLSTRKLQDIWLLHSHIGITYNNWITSQIRKLKKVFRMVLYKSIIITIVAAALLSSNGFAIHLLRKCPHFRNDVTFPLLVSLFTAGLTQGMMAVLVCVVSWFNLQWVTLLLQCAHFLQLVSTFASYFSLCCVSSLKLYSVLKPFVVRRLFTTFKISLVTSLIWMLCVSSVAPVFFYPDVITFKPVSQTPMFIFKENIISVIIMKFAVPTLYVIVCLIVLSNSILFGIAVKHAIRINLMKRPTEREQTEGEGHPPNEGEGHLPNEGEGHLPNEGEGRLTRAVIAALWSAKGVMILSLLKLTVHLPFFIRLRDTSNDVFYIHWIFISGPFLDVVCFIGCSKTLRQLIMLWCKCSSNKVEQNTVQIQTVQ